MPTQTTGSSQPSQEPVKKSSALTPSYLAAKNFGQTKEVREFENGKVEIIEFGDRVVGRSTLQPGWRWSKAIKPLARTESCEATHFQYHVSGTLHVKLNDGTEIECKPGEVSLIPPGHDAWVVGNEPVVLIDFQGMTNFAKDSEPHQH